MSSTDREAIDEEGEPDRAFLGIDGTMGDAQDEDHLFIASVYGEWCRVCGLAAAYSRHTIVKSIKVIAPDGTVTERGWERGS